MIYKSLKAIYHYYEHLTDTNKSDTIGIKLALNVKVYLPLKLGESQLQLGTKLVETKWLIASICRKCRSVRVPILSENHIEREL